MGVADGIIKPWADGVTPAQDKAGSSSSITDDIWLARSRTELDAVYIEALAARRSIAAQPPDDPYFPRLDGVAAALGWVLGMTAQSPVTEHTTYRARPACDVTAVRYELGLARGHARVAENVGDRAYLDGVVGALSWATGDVTRPPC